MSWQLFDRLRAFFRSENIHRHENLQQDQPDISKVAQGGRWNLGMATSGALLEQTNLSINRMERYKDYDQMDEMGEVSAALDIYADEGCLSDPDRKRVLMIRARSGRVRDALEELFYVTLMTDKSMRSWFRYLCKYGDLPLEIIPTKNRDGIASVRPLNVYNFSRVENRQGDLIGFFYQDENTTKPNFLHPWQVVHFRLSSLENIFLPMGKSVLEGGRKDFKRLRLMEDAALIYRILRAPERRVFKVPIGELPANQVPAFMETFARTIKKKRFYNPSTGQLDERWSPLIQEDDYFMPRRPDGTGPEVDTLPGAENLDQIADIEYFKKKMVASLKVPFSRVGIGEPGEDGRQSLSQVAPEFAKAVQWIQREMCVGLHKLGLVHLALKEYSSDELKHWQLYMTAGSAIDELYRIEKWSTRADVMTTLKDMDYFSPRWILRTFTDLSDDEIDEMQREKKYELPDVPTSGEIGGLPEGTSEEDRRLLIEYEQFKENRKNRQKILEENATGLSKSLMIAGELRGLKTKDGTDRKDIMCEDIVSVSELFEINGKAEQKFLIERKEYEDNLEKEKMKKRISEEITEDDLPPR